MVSHRARVKLVNHPDRDPYASRPPSWWPLLFVIACSAVGAAATAIVLGRS